MLEGLDYLWVALGGVAAGLVNAMAGGGTLVSFPILTAVGISPVAANVTNTVALCPGFVGGIAAQRADLRDQARRLWIALPVGGLGGLAGGLLLLHTRESAFRALVPYLILGATALLALQNRLRLWILKHPTHPSAPVPAAHIAVPVGLGAIYGGYFGAGLGVILLAVLGLAIDDTLARLNALKQTIALVVNFTAAVLFLFSGKVVWQAAALMAIGSIAGGALGGRLASGIDPARLRAIVLAIGVTVGLIYLWS